MQNTSIQVYQFSLDSAIAEWVAQKKIRTGSIRTEKAYQDTMDSFRAFLRQGNLDLLDTPIDIARVAGLWANMRTLTSKTPGAPVSPSTYNQRLAILSSFYTFLNATYKPREPYPNPIETIKKRPVQAYAAATPLDENETVTGLESIDRSTLEGMRNYALLSVALATGRRANELVRLRWEHVKVSGKKETRLTLTFHCKGDKIMVDQLDAETSGVVLDYLHAQYGKNLMQLQSAAPLWVSYSNLNQGKAISAKTLSNICLKVFNTGKCHTLRHTFADAMMESGSPITELGDRLGHTSILVTQIYAKKLRGANNPYSEKLTTRFHIHRKKH